MLFFDDCLKYSRGGIVFAMYFVKECQVWNEGMNCGGHSFQDGYGLLAFGFLFDILARYIYIHGLLQSLISYSYSCICIKKTSRAFEPITPVIPA